MKRIALMTLSFCLLVAGCTQPEQPDPGPTPVTPSVISVNSVTLNQSSVAMLKGGTVQLTAEVLPSNATNKAVSWSSTPAEVASVNQSGLVTALKSGTAIITAKSGEKSASCTILVTNPVESVTLDPAVLTLEEGQSFTLVVSIHPDDADEKTVVWTTSDAQVAAVEDGKVTAIKEGTATIMAKVGEKSAACEVVVKKIVVPVERVTLTPNSLTLEEGQTSTLVASIYPDDADEQTVVWTTSDAQVATVEDGKVSAVKAGTATITAKAGDKSADCAVTVTAPQKPFSISPSSVEIGAEGGSFSVTVMCSTEYHISSKPDWVMEESASNKEHVFIVEANPVSDVRSGVIVFCDDKGTCLPCSVKQEAAATEILEVNPASLSFESHSGSSTFTIFSNQSWTVTSDQSWCQVSPESGANEGSVSVTVSANESSEIRKASITISTSGKTLQKTISVIQEGFVTPGSFDWNQSFYHRSLVMRFTATWCGWCPRMNKSVHLAEEQNPGKIEVLNLHGGGSELEFSGTDMLMDQYCVGGFPTGLVDGRRLVENYDINYTASLIGQYLKETENNYPVSSAISYESSWSGQKLNVDLSLYLRYAANYKVTVMLLEGGIKKVQSDYEEGDHGSYVHDRVARMAVSSISGDSFTTTKDQEEKQFHYSVSVPSSYKIANLRILVYVQREFGPQTRIQTSSSYGNYYVDNSASGVAGGSLAVTVKGKANGGNEGITPGEDINMQ